MHFYEAFNGQEALQIAHSQRPDVIFLDLHMPQVDGRAVIETLAADWRTAPDTVPEQARIPIVVVSVRSVEEESTPLAGAMHIERPGGFTLSELLQLLNAVLPMFTRAEAVSPASAAARLSKLSG
jgi:CheY-like chemotaxis protein